MSVFRSIGEVMMKVERVIEEDVFRGIGEVMLINNKKEDMLWKMDCEMLEVNLEDVLEGVLLEGEFENVYKMLEDVCEDVSFEDVLEVCEDVLEGEFEWKMLEGELDTKVEENTVEDVEEDVEEDTDEEDTEMIDEEDTEIDEEDTECKVEEDSEIDEEVVWKWRGMLRKISKDDLCNILECYYSIIVNVNEEICEEMRMDLCKYMLRYCNKMCLDLSVCKYMLKNISDSIFVNDMSVNVNDMSLILIGGEVSSIVFYTECLFITKNVKLCKKSELSNILCIYDSIKCAKFINNGRLNIVTNAKVIEFCNDPSVLKSKYKGMFEELRQ